jgi:hypothetical protein
LHIINIKYTGVRALATGFYLNGFIVTMIFRTFVELAEKQCFGSRTKVVIKPAINIRIIRARADSQPVEK